VEYVDADQDHQKHDIHTEQRSEDPISTDIHRHGEDLAVLSLGGIQGGLTKKWKECRQTKHSKGKKKTQQRVPGSQVCWLVFMVSLFDKVPVWRWARCDVSFLNKHQIVQPPTSSFPGSGRTSKDQSRTGRAKFRLRSEDIIEKNQEVSNFADKIEERKRKRRGVPWK